MFDLPDMPSKEQIAQHSDLLTYAGVILISTWGGVVHYLNDKSKTPFSWRDLIANLLSSSFAGVVTFLACQYAHVPGPLTGVLCAVAGHMGTPALIQLSMRLKVVRNFLVTEEPKDTTK